MIPSLQIHYQFESGENITTLQNQYLQSPTSTEVAIRYAECLASDEQYLNASQLFLKVAQLNSRHEFDCYFKAGVCLLTANNFVEAIKCFKLAIKLNREHYLLQTFMGLAFFHLGLIGRANKHWWAAYQLNKTKLIIDILNKFFSDDNHPERLALYPICQGRGIDVGCGNRKTHPDAIGVDLTPGGVKGHTGSVTGKESAADIMSSGDNLWMFKDGELDYVVQRHNLEHYQDYIKALQEWKRIVKHGGRIGMVIPDDETCDTIQLDPSHKHVFTQASLRRVIGLIGGLKIVYMRELLKNWSFVCILQKTGCNHRADCVEFDYGKIIRDFECAQLVEKAERYASEGEHALAHQCRDYIDHIDASEGSSTVNR